MGSPAKAGPGRSIEDFVRGIKDGDRVVLSQAITLVESTRGHHRRARCGQKYVY